DGFGDVRILADQELRRILNHCDPTAEAAEGLRKLHPDIAAAEHDQVLGQTIDLQRLDMGQGSRVGQAWDVGDHRVRAKIETAAPAPAPARPPRPHARPARRGSKEGPRAEEKSAPFGREPFGGDPDRAAALLALARAPPRHVRRHGPAPLPVLRRVPQEIRDLGAVDHVLARQARNVGARPADQSALNDDGPAALPSELPGHVLSWLRSAENEVLDLVTVRHDVLQNSQIAVSAKAQDGDLSRGVLSRNCPSLAQIAQAKMPGSMSAPGTRYRGNSGS